jgi:hypothetical protein
LSPLQAAGSDLDFLRRTKAGANALQLARGRRCGPAVALLEGPTEAAAAVLQEALLRELEVRAESSLPKCGN